MARAFLSLIGLSLLLTSGVSAQNEPMINVRGKVLSANDSTAVPTSILYEKLPYYDDMGMASAGGTGEFSFYLAKGVTYNISIRKDNYKALNQEVKVLDEDNDANDVMNFYLEILVEEEVFTLKNVIFSRSSDVLQKESYAELDLLIDRLKQNSAMIIQLEGHTDFAGNPDANLVLSEARVESVRKYLIKGGINKDRLLTKAYGGTKPLYEERTPEAMALNRRVEVRIIKK